MLPWFGDGERCEIWCGARLLLMIKNSRKFNCASLYIKLYFFSICSVGAMLLLFDYKNIQFCMFVPPDFCIFPSFNLQAGLPKDIKNNNHHLFSSLDKKWMKSRNEERRKIFFFNADTRLTSSLFASLSSMCWGWIDCCKWIWMELPFRTNFTPGDRGYENCRFQ